MRSYLFEPAVQSQLNTEKAQDSSASIDDADDYDFAHLDGVAKEYDPVEETECNPLKKTFKAVGAASLAGWRRIVGMSRKQQIITLVSTIVVAIVLGITLGYLTPDDDDTPYPASYYHHNNEEVYTVSSTNADDVQMAALAAEVSSGDGAAQYNAMPDAPVVSDDGELATTGFFGGLFGIGNLFGSRSNHYTLSMYQFETYQELALVNNVAYCVPDPGLSSPFNCTRACEIFSGVELNSTFTNTESDTSCTGYIAIDHVMMRIMVVFRGTQSMTNWMTNLDTVQEPYEPAQGCPRCLVHRGFMRSWMETRTYVTPVVAELVKKYPDYTLVVTGHSLGGAIAVLAGAELVMSGFAPAITTYGQPRVGNSYFADWFDYTVSANDVDFTRITHKSDPVPRVPLGIDYTHTSGEIYIAEGPLSPSPEDCYICSGQEDSECSAGEGVVTTLALQGRDVAYRAHVEYFTRIGLCRFQI
ncbi:Alpha/Beta hydrolase protein [Lipomyces arxii]|uniref:Alpha/Beta hydrolase protein n=1 Tax=Lipomyces arxii TaxID=56418 RepID=UPI0034CF7380